MCIIESEYHHSDGRRSQPQPGYRYRTGESVKSNLFEVMNAQSLVSSLSVFFLFLQVEGAFMQGLGLFTLEELHYSPKGVLLTRGPGAYKIPAFGDIPTHLTVSLLRDAPNEKAIFASKVTPAALLIPTEINAEVMFVSRLMFVSSGCRRASALSGIVSFLCHQRCRQRCQGRVWHQRSLQARQPRLCRKDSQCLRGQIHKTGTKVCCETVLEQSFFYKCNQYLITPVNTC